MDIFMVDRTLLLHRQGRAFVRIPATPSALTAAARLSGVPSCPAPDISSTGGSGRAGAMVTSVLDKAGLLEWGPRPSGVSNSPQNTKDSAPRFGRACIKRMRISGSDAQASEPVVFVVESWADLALFDPSAVPVGRPWAVCRVRAGTVQISSLLQLPEPTMCWECLLGRLLGHDDLLRAIWPRLSSGACVRLTAGGMPSEETMRLVRSALRSVTADACPGILRLDVGEEASAFLPVSPYATCRHGHRYDRSWRSSAGPGSCADPTKGLTRARLRLEPLTGPVTGLIEPARTVADLDLPIHVATVRYADASGEGSTVAVHPDGSITHDSRLRREAFGSGLTAEQARVRAGLEGLERYCSVQQAHDPLLLRERSLADQAHLCPERNIVVPAGPDLGCCAEQEWVLCTPLEGMSAVAVPAAMCFHRAARPAISGGTGMALGETPEDAVVTGFLEYLEREAVNRWWRQGPGADRIRLDLVADELVEIMVSYHRERGRSLFALRVPPPMPGIEAVVAVSSLSQRGFPLLGMGAGFTLTTAAAKALREVGQALAFEQAERRKWASVPHSAVRWLADQATAPFSMSDDGGSTVPPATDGLTRVTNLSRAVGRTPLILNYQRPEVPFPCVRVLVPSALGDESVPCRAAPGSGRGELPW
ncbi:YcaO-like family protein [Thermobifida halotolerans]|uniref:YcaO-like family protein n=2 Tax=Thermobifida halotolerans TaxID=483545 RepID=A0AA97LWM4_9ACTN|nr:YcaO-like family protein [Thermobifida halotolerans]UOE19335.1 YcaO-like family protein [Thermobifida halotolerans]